jgi:hypothetical protein
MTNKLRIIEIYANKNVKHLITQWFPIFFFLRPLVNVQKSHALSLYVLEFSVDLDFKRSFFFLTIQNNYIIYN